MENEVTVVSRGGLDTCYTRMDRALARLEVVHLLAMYRGDESKLERPKRGGSDYGLGSV
jgi:hypothetical protein